jgi:hypothetical protein
MPVSHKLKKTAAELQLPFNRVCDVFALERLVARLETDPVLSEGLTYKGGFVLFKTAATDRYTRDVDATVRSVAKNVLISKLLHLWELELKDGIAYGEPEITELQIADGDYGGIRLTLRYQLDVQKIETEKIKKLPRINLDICIGDTGPEVSFRRELPSVSEDSEKVSWKVLSLNYIFAEKLQTMVVRGDANSRGKDIYDMWFLSKSLQNMDDLRDALTSSPPFVSQ